MFERLRSHAALLVGALASVVCALVYTWPLARGFGALSTQLPRRGPDPIFHTWAIHTWHGRWDAFDFFPFFDANNFFPHQDPLAFSDTFFGQAVLSYPFHLAGAGPVLTHNLCFLLVYALFAGCAYASGFVLTRSIAGGLTALVAAGFAQTRFTHLDHHNIQSGLFIAPMIACWLKLLFAPSRKAAIGLGLSAGLQWWFTGQVTVFSTVAIALPFAIATLARLVLVVRERGPWRAWLLRFAEGALIAAVVCAPIVAGHLAVNNALANERTVEDNLWYAITPTDYLQSTHTSYWQRLFTARGGSPHYLGTFAVGLALVGVVMAWRRRRSEDARATLDHPLAATCVLLVGIASLVFSFGPLWKPGATTPLPYYYLLDLFPPLTSLRAPARFYVPLGACVALLASLGAAWLSRTRLWPLVPVVIALVAWDLWPPPFPMRTSPPRSPVLEQLGEQHPGAAINELPDGRPENETATWRSIFHRLDTTLGTSGTTPPLTGALRCRANRFPDDEQLALMRAIGVEYIAVHDGMRPWTRFVPSDGLPPGVALAKSAGGTRIFSIGPPQPSHYGPDDVARGEHPLILSSRVASGMPVNASLDLRAMLPGPRITVHPAMRAEVRLLQQGERRGGGKTLVRLPPILDANVAEAPFTFVAPQREGALDVELWANGKRLASGRTVVAQVPLGETATSLAGATLALDASLQPWLTGRCGHLRIDVRNGSAAILQAYPRKMVLPPEAGRAVVDLEWLRGGQPVKTWRVHQWMTRQAVLWRDLAPGDEASVVVDIEAPETEGSYTLRARLGAVARGHFAQTETTVEVRSR